MATVKFLIKYGGNTEMYSSGPKTTDQKELECTEEEARELYGKLKELFEKDQTLWLPPDYPNSPPYYVGDTPSNWPNPITTCGSTSERCKQ